MNLVEHAERELTLMGYTEDSEEGPNKWMRESLLDLIKLFSAQGHSGGTAPYCLGLFQKLAAREPLTPLTGEDSEWEDVSHVGDPSVQYQNKRCSRVLKGPDGIAFDVMSRVLLFPDGTSTPDRAAMGDPIEFPYVPQTEIVKVDAEGVPL